MVGAVAQCQHVVGAALRQAFRLSSLNIPRSANTIGVRRPKRSHRSLASWPHCGYISGVAGEHPLPGGTRSWVTANPDRDLSANLALVL